MYDFSNAWGDYARYLPALNDTYARFAIGTDAARHRDRLPRGVRAKDFDFFNPRTRLTYWPNALYTAMFGTKDRDPTVVSARPREATFVLGDSGGFAVISGALQASQASFREDVLRWQERDCDVGVILDVPTRSLSMPESGFARLDDCLARTKANALYAVNARSSSSLTLLNVMQGRDHKEAKYWCDAMSDVKLDGVAIGGDTRLDMWFWCSRFIEMLEQQQFDHVRHIHFLGTCQPAFAVLATALQRALRRYVRTNISVTFDSSLAFRIAQQFGQFTTGLTLGESGFKLTSHTLARRGGDVDREARFPFASPIGDLCRVGDVLPGETDTEPALDTVGGHILSNHAVHMELSCILLANRLVDMKQTGKNSPVPWNVRQGVEAIDEIFAGTMTGAALARKKKFLNFVSPDDRDRRGGADGDGA